jgi:hypothetical protein
VVPVAARVDALPVDDATGRFHYVWWSKYDVYAIIVQCGDLKMYSRSPAARFTPLGDRIIGF